MELDVKVDLSATMQSVLQQLADRLREELEEADEVAVSTAVHHALFRGFRLGFELARTTCQEQMLEDYGVEIPPPEFEDDEESEVDIWLERYGSGLDEGDEMDV